METLHDEILDRLTRNPADWANAFRVVFDRAAERYRSTRTDAGTLFTEPELSFLATIGCSRFELFDLVEDHVRGGDPGYEDVLLLTAARRDYFLFVQNGVPSGKVINVRDLPAKSDEVDGIAWLPRIIEKARAKLRGEMPPELMYGCGGDRPFCRNHNIHLADLLSVVRVAGDDTKRIVDYVKQQARIV